MMRLIAGSALAFLSLVMLAGFFGSSTAASIGARIAAFVIAVILPGATGAGLLISHFRGKGQFKDRREMLRQQTIESEVMRLAGAHGGKLTIAETVTALAITADTAKTALDALALNGLAEYEVTESGIIVYAFPDVQNLAEKSKSKGILE
jgi:hypothetical protein